MRFVNIEKIHICDMNINNIIISSSHIIAVLFLAIKCKFHYLLDKNMGHLIITETGTLHCIYIDINVELIPLLHLQNLPLFWEGFP